MKKQSKFSQIVNDKKFYVPALAVAMITASYVGYKAGTIAEKFYAIATLEEKLIPDGDSLLGKFAGSNPMALDAYAQPAGPEEEYSQGSPVVPGGYR